MTSGRDSAPFDIDAQIDAAIASGRWDDARAAIEQELAKTPANWKPFRQEGGSLICSFWDNEEFLSFAAHQRRSNDGMSIVWAGQSYSKLWWQLALVNRKQGLHSNALTCIENGLELEPDHPHLWMQKGLVLSETKQYGNALTAFKMATTVRSWAPASIVAWALRQQGFALIELDRLDEAQAAYRHSLEIDPDNEVAERELEYIERILRERDQQPKQLPWFMHALRFPPKDPVTRELIALVDGMPTVPGPQTVGAENYSRISKAFYESGWEGFEKEFNLTVAPDRPDYMDIKRDLLREPIFLKKVHERMSRIVLGETTIEEVVDEANRPRTFKKH